MKLTVYIYMNGIIYVLNIRVSKYLFTSARSYKYPIFYFIFYTHYINTIYYLDNNIFVFDTS